MKTCATWASAVAFSAVLALLIAAPVSASTFVLNFTGTFSNNTVPQGTSPYVRATFDDTLAGAGYDVRLTIETLGLVGTEFISETDFNLWPSLDPTDLQFNQITFTTPIVTGVNCCKADGDGKYDISFLFPTSGANVMDGGSTYVVDINLTTGTLLPIDFNFLSQPSGGSGPFLAASHLQSIGANGSGSTWLFATTTGFPPPPPPPPRDVPVPEPTSLVLLGTGLVWGAGRMRGRRKTE